MTSYCFPLFLIFLLLRYLDGRHILGIGSSKKPVELKRVQALFGCESDGLGAGVLEVGLDVVDFAYVLFVIFSGGVDGY